MAHSPFDLQQTPETIRHNVDTWHNLHCVSDDQAEIGRRQYRADKARSYKLRLIRRWRLRDKIA